MEHHRGHLGDTDWWTPCPQILILQVEGRTQESAHVTHSQRDLSASGSQVTLWKPLYHIKLR